MIWIGVFSVIGGLVFLSQPLWPAHLRLDRLLRTSRANDESQLTVGMLLICAGVVTLIAAAAAA